MRTLWALHALAQVSADLHGGALIGVHAFKKLVGVRIALAVIPGSVDIRKRRQRLGLRAAHQTREATKLCFAHCLIWILSGVGKSRLIGQPFVWTTKAVDTLDGHLLKIPLVHTRAVVLRMLRRQGTRNGLSIIHRLRQISRVLSKEMLGIDWRRQNANNALMLRLHNLFLT